MPGGVGRGGEKSPPLPDWKFRGCRLSFINRGWKAGASYPFIGLKLICIDFPVSVSVEKLTILYLSPCASVSQFLIMHRLPLGPPSAPSSRFNFIYNNKRRSSFISHCSIIILYFLRISYITASLSFISSSDQ